MPASGSSANVAMLAGRLLDSTGHGVDCADRPPPAPTDSTPLVREVTAHARALAPERLVSSCSNASGDVRIHRVFIFMEGSKNGITVSK